MKNIFKSVVQMKTLSIVLSKSASAQQNSYLFPYKLCQVKSCSLARDVVPNRQKKSLRNSPLIISTACKGIVFCPDAVRNLNPNSKKLSTVLYVPDKDQPGREGHGHEKILEELQKQLERLKKDTGRLERSGDEKFPKYKPK